jgi:ribosomal protein S12 methylthiotransferase
MPKISIVSLGCPKNTVDSDTLLTGLKREGFVYTPDAEDADFVFVNTCGFIEDAKRESVEEILRLKQMKEEGRRLLVFGCLVERYRDELMKEIPEIDALWGVGEEERIIEYCKSAVDNHSQGHGRPDREDQTPEAERPGSDDWRPETHAYAYLKIAEGCNRGCTFCVIPSIRGPYRSLEPEKILRKAEEYISSGKKELILVAQDIVSYGKEFRGYDLSSLLKDISSLSGDFWVRLLYLYPTAISDELLSTIAGTEKICRYLDIPLQHSEDTILRDMGRGGTKAFSVKTIAKIREAIPDITLRTTFIVGFPGETEDDVDGLKRFIEEQRFDRLGVFMYSREKGTPAARMKGHVPRKIKERRLDEIMKIQARISLEKNKALAGKKCEVLVDEVGRGSAIARLSSQAPEIDGVVFIEEMHGGLTPLDSRSIRPGEFVHVLITEAYDYDLKGELME